LITGCRDFQDRNSPARYEHSIRPLPSFSIQAQQDARDAGAQGYLVKPSDIADLADEVARLIAEAKIAFPVAVDLPQ